MGRGLALGFFAALPLVVEAESEEPFAFDLRSLFFSAAEGLGAGSGGGLRIVPALLF